MTICIRWRYRCKSHENISCFANIFAIFLQIFVSYFWWDINELYFGSLSLQNIFLPHNISLTSRSSSSTSSCSLARAGIFSWDGCFPFFMMSPYFLSRSSLKSPTSWKNDLKWSGLLKLRNSCQIQFYGWKTINQIQTAKKSKTNPLSICRVIKI